MEKGVALVIRRAKVPVVPVVIDGSFEAWPKQDKVFHSSPVRVYYGRPMDLSKLDRDEILETIDQTFRKMLAELKEGNVPLDGRGK